MGKTKIIELTLYKLKFLSSVHLGTREGFFESCDVILHSDTFFSAFCNSFHILYGRENLDALLKRFLSGDLPFLVSSAFPFSEDKLFFPVPLNQMPSDKDYKKIEYVEKSQFEKLLHGECIEKIAKPEDKQFRLIINTPRIAINRINNSPGENFFFFSEMFFTVDSGLFFVVDFKDAAFKKQFDATLNLISQEGIGADRTCGKGHFNVVEISKIEFMLSADTDGSVLLSLYHPEEKEFGQLKDGFYQIIERKGYIYSPYARNYRRKSVRMVEEGSVVPGNVVGCLVDITPEIFDQHKVYRYGFALSLPCKTGAE
ncbi:MAG: type III-A CRISPR-associated RAMP protein Csm4 [Candidatus Omnitrophica bacterium]|nr:type III-A CRISPR-associated RAMP protein Csm4 [Candidatus Omnitrophota bacterium]MCM8827662.1 type III-A CRISPR-associated RAMP protein Csm4 [Candidatus Omnitrophota bacterium]